jgi:hypothetical protein
MFSARCVPNMYLFGTFSAQNAEESRASSALRWQPAGRDNNPSLQALRRAAKGWMEECGQPAASVATGGRTHAKKRLSCRQASETIPPGLIWSGKGGFQVP